MNPLRKLTNIFASIAKRWNSSRLSKAQRQTNFVIQTETESETNHIIIHQNVCYRVLIDPESINVINIHGKPVSEPDLIVQLLKRIHDKDKSDKLMERISKHEY
ncbi:hypothetical protein ACET9H_20930 [Aeromonas media]|uniref:hypothetical protein n=1 Tax=Aeromonas media TaxID=651 RepID=UPI0038CF8A86